MIKYRIHEVAKDFNVSSKKIIEILDRYMGKDVKRNHMSTLSPNELNYVFEEFTQKNRVESLESFFATAQKAKKEPAQQAKEKKEPAPAVAAEGKKNENTQKHRKGVRIVDTRGVSVDLSKFDERLEKLVPERAGRQMETAATKQKINNRRSSYQQRGRRNNYVDKAALEAEKLKRAEKYKKIQLEVSIPDELSVGELSHMLKVTSVEVIKKLMQLGVMASVSQIIDFDTASLIAEELGAKVTHQVTVSIEEVLFDESEDKKEDLIPRAPVVVVMGHVDHGKTSLLDAIRNAKVASGEAGGITQHIGAYRVKINGENITFLDTPGHEAFTAMRARGAQVTDIAILVVAADDGIMPQTVEAINHAKAAGVSIIVAINKMDKPTANPDRIKQELTEYELVPEEWGGDTICCPVSAIKHEGIENLLEMVLLTAEMKELKANPNRKAKGTVIESKLDKGRGPIATILVQNGTLNVGDAVIAGTAVGRIRAMTDDKGRKIQKAGPSVPVEIIGLSEVPDGGDLFYAVDDEKMARELSGQRKQAAKDELYKNLAPKVTLDDLFNQIKEGEVKTLNIIVKADVQGSVEAVRQSLEKLSCDEVKVKVIHGGVGGIRESDVMLASASSAIIVGFNVRPDAGAAASAELSGVDVRTYRIIYDAIDEITSAMKGMLAPKFKEVVIGHAEIRQTFKISSIGTIAGCYVQDGKIVRNAKVRIVRNGIVIHEGELSSLKRFKDDAKEVAMNFECGMSIERFNDIKEGDIIEAYIIEEIKPQ
jgi:translation initiation factor IF-2